MILEYLLTEKIIVISIPENKGIIFMCFMFYLLDFSETFFTDQ